MITLSLEQKQKLHQFYLASRALAVDNQSIICPIQRGFEEVMIGVLDSYSWRPTHISPMAAREVMEGNKSNIQRAHGIMGRLDRYERTIKILTGPEQKFEDWWQFYLEHDATVLLTKKEHHSGKAFQLSELIELPSYPDLIFPSAGFSFKVRKKVEIAWLKANAGCSLA
ncbi:MAG: hypothetical protein EBR82_16185 [Caulobacteraceae bacterium]|nr:hypothetical protein [Caulobacteraceae bacterium]